MNNNINKDYDDIFKRISINKYVQNLYNNN